MGTGTAGEPQALIYPLSLRMQGRLAVVAGGGSVAVRRVAGLRAAGAHVLVVAPQLSPSLNDLASRELITVRRRGYLATDLEGAWLVLACTDRPDVNAAIVADAERQRIWCVRADDAAASPAWVPAVGRSAGTTVAVSAGRDPSRAAALRDRCVEAVEAAGRCVAGQGRARGDGRGRVSIVGGGPGDPGLITVAGLQRLRSADVVVTDRLAPLEVLADLPPDVQIIDAAKVPAGPAMRQDHINRVLVEHARAGRAVIRLKGGDPFVFGRGREEVEACLAAGVPVEVVPGVTSAVSVPASAGIPVTHRGLSQGFTVISGHVSPSDPGSTIGWAALARTRTTLVLLMAIDHLADSTGALLAAGLAADTPAACVADGWTRHQRVVTAPLRDIAAAVRNAGITSPAVVVIGDVVQLTSALPGLQATPGPGPADHPGRRVLVLGGARSGKSATAEGMLAGGGPVDYIATGPPPGADDPEWAARVRGHQQRRPASWRTAETLSLDQLLASPDTATAVLVDCLSTWLARVMDDCGTWAGRPDADRALAARVDRLVEAWRASRRHVVAVSNEVGSGVVPATASGRRFRDELGRLNARIAAECDEVWLCTAGIARRLR